MTNILSIRDIRVSYRHWPAVNGITLEVKQNEVFALLGPTGAGKSSTLLAIAGLIPLDSGSIEISSENVTDSRPSQRDIAMVFEGINLLPTLDVKGNIAFALRSPAYREEEDEIQSRVKNVAATLKISNLLDRDVETLSGGERQRVAIARALVRRPSLYLLDEPLSALDLKLREELQAELRSIHKQHDSTILYATHDFHGAAAIADRIGVIEEGIIHQTDTLQELIRNPNNTTVGRLIGSPAMAFFDAQICDASIVIKGTNKSIPMTKFGSLTGDNRDLVLGFWPNDIEILKGEGTGLIYAVDNRGFENAVQVQTPAGSFRKIIPESLTIKQGDACNFNLPDDSGFLFCPVSGKRVSKR